MTSTKRKQVNVTFAGDDDVLSHIIAINEKNEGGSKKAGRARKTEEADEDVVPMEQEEDHYKPSIALTDEKDLAGEEVFAFKSFKKKDQMAAVAQTSAQLAQNTTGSPKSVLKSAGAVKTPLRKKVLLEKNNNTPQRLRKRNKAEYLESSSEDSGSSTEEESENEAGSKVKSKSHLGDQPSENSSMTSPSRTEDSVATTPSIKRPAKSADTPSRSTKGIGSTPAIKKPRGRPKKNVDYTVESEEVQHYFSQQGEANKTSDRTLSRLECPRLDQETLNQVLCDVTDPYATEKADLYSEHAAQFKKWMFYMCNGYNILLCGVGSKRLLLEDFRTKILGEYTHLVINGYFPSITIKNILNSITEDILEHKGCFRSPVDQCEFIRKHFECGDIHEDIYLVINNIDGAMLRQEKIQTVISLLAQIKGFHIVASIDHINAPLIWDQSKYSRFNWLWQDVTTYAPYTEETSYENSLLVQQSGVLALSSLTHVFKSLTPNARGIFQLLARYQLDNTSNNYNGLAFPDLYQRCREAFLVNSDLTLRTQLTEFRDHKLIRTKKVDGMEYLVIPLDDATLKEFIQQQEEES